MSKSVNESGMIKFTALRRQPVISPQKLAQLSIEERRYKIVNAAIDQADAEALQSLGLRHAERTNGGVSDHIFRDFDHVGAYVVETSNRDVAERAMATLAADYLIIPNIPLALPHTQLSRRYRRRPPSKPQWSDVSGIELAHKHGITGKGVLVGILDTGCDADHLELRDKLIDFRYVPPEPSRRLLRNVRGFDVDGHGTHVTGIVGGKNVGVAPGVELMVASVIESENLLSSMERIVQALDRMLSKFRLEENLTKPTIINMSLGFPPDSLVDAQLEDVFAGVKQILVTLAALEVLPIFAVGNDGPGAIRVPADLTEGLSVGAVDINLVPATFSGGGRSPNTHQLEPDLVGYGVEIFSGLEREIDGRSIYADMSGTSMAAPYVTGIAALIAAADPCMHVRDLRQCLLARTLRLDDPPERVGAGLARFAP